MRFRSTRRWVAGAYLILTGSIGFAAPSPLSFTVIEQHPHDKKIFTQGLEMLGRQLVESSGLYRRSFFRVYDPITQEIKKHIDLPSNIFAEGLTRVEDKLYVLSWQSKKAFVYDIKTWSLEKTFDYAGQGWGLCFDGDHLFMSDGSNTLTVRHPITFDVVRKIQVVDENGKVQSKLNELECAEGKVWANQWKSSHIFQIDPNAGEVTGVVDLSKLVPFNYRNSRETVLNGIAYDKTKNAYWVTGKYWNKLFLIQVSSSKEIKNGAEAP